MTHEYVTELFRRESRSLEVIQSREFEESRVGSDVGSGSDGFDGDGEFLERVEAIELVQVLQREGTACEK